MCITQNCTFPAVHFLSFQQWCLRATNIFLSRWGFLDEAPFHIISKGPCLYCMKAWVLFWWIVFLSASPFIFHKRKILCASMPSFLFWIKNDWHLFSHCPNQMCFLNQWVFSLSNKVKKEINSGVCLELWIPLVLVSFFQVLLSYFPPLSPCTDIHTWA